MCLLLSCHKFSRPPMDNVTLESALFLYRYCCTIFGRTFKVIQPSQCDSSYKNEHLYQCRQGNEPYNEKLPSHLRDRVRAAPHSHLSPPISAGTGSAWGPGSFLAVQQQWALVCACHSWGILLWKSVSAQERATGMCVNKCTCIFLAVGITVSSLARNMDECL